MSEVVEFLQRNEGVALSSMQICSALDMNWGTFKNDLAKIRKHDIYAELVHTFYLVRTRHGRTRIVGYHYYFSAIQKPSST